jgi:hypothetical protein
MRLVAVSPPSPSRRGLDPAVDDEQPLPRAPEGDERRHEEVPREAQQREEVPREAPRRWAGTFGPASEEPYRRRPSDAVRLAVAIAIVAWFVLRVPRVSGLERSVFEFFNSAPNGLHQFFRAIYRVGFILVLGLVGAAALIGRRWRLVRDLVLAGVGSALVAVALNHAVGEPAGAAALFHLVRRWPAGPGFPSTRLAFPGWLATRNLIAHDYL